MSWLTDNLPGIAATIGGGVLTATGMGAGIGIPLMAGGLGYMGQENTNEQNQKLASDAADRSQAQAIQQEQYQTQMSNTAYQRQAADMTAAGINPIMAGVQGGASTPGGASGAVPVAHMDSQLGAGLNSAKAASDTIQNIESTGSQVALNNAMAKKATADAITSAASAKQMARQTDMLDTQMPAVKAKSSYDAGKYNFDKDYIKFDSMLSRAAGVGGVANSAAQLLSPFMGLFKGATGGQVHGGDNNPWFYDEKAKGIINQRSGEFKETWAKDWDK